MIVWDTKTARQLDYLLTVGRRLGLWCFTTDFNAYRKARSRRIL